MHVKPWLFAAILMGSATPALAHVTVSPRESRPGAQETYQVRAPNERRTATVRIEASFPPGLAVSALEPKPGWSVEPRRDPSGAIVGAVWTGALPPAATEVFGVAAVNPSTGEALTWRFTQVYADGETVEWSGPPGSRTPAPVVSLAPSP